MSIFLWLLIIWVLIGWITWLGRAIEHYSWRDSFEFDWGIFTSRTLLFACMGGIALMEVILGWADWDEMERNE